MRNKASLFHTIHGNTCKWQLHFDEISEILLLFNRNGLVPFVVCRCDTQQVVGFIFFLLLWTREEIKPPPSMRLPPSVSAFQQFQLENEPFHFEVRFIGLFSRPPLGIFFWDKWDFFFIILCYEIHRGDAVAVTDGCCLKWFPTGSAVCARLSGNPACLCLTAPFAPAAAVR